MAEKHPLSIDRASTADANWPTLIERAVDDVARILRSEAHMFQTSIEANLQLQISNMVTHLTIIAAIISGALCILRAAIFLLHQGSLGGRPLESPALPFGLSGSRVTQS